MAGPNWGANTWPRAGASVVPDQQPQYQQQYDQQHYQQYDQQHYQQYDQQHYQQGDQQQQYSSYPPPQQVPIFQVSIMRHTGALIYWFNQRSVISGTYAQCDAALRSAQTHNFVAGWWSFLSILIMNWVAISNNSSARKKLDADARQAQAYAQWWYQYIGPGRA